MPHRRLFKTDSWEYGHDTRALEQPLEAPKKRRAATTVLFAALFFAGAAFTAVAGDELASVAGSNSTDATAQAGATTDTTSTDATAAPNATAPDATAPATDASTPASAATSDPTAASPAASDASAPSDAVAASPTDASGNVQSDSITPARTGGQAAGAATAPASRAAEARAAAAASPSTNWRLSKAALRKALLPQRRPVSPPEIEGPAQNATIWLNSPLPDPTPPAVRLSAKFALHLQSAARGAGVDWALELAVLRAKGATGHNPADRSTLVALSKRLASLDASVVGDWATALAYDGSPDFADRVQALARYDRAIGIGALVHGLESAKQALGQAILNDPSIDIYAGGRNDIAENKVDVRVLALISYLHQAFGEVTVSSLISGHRLYARPGVISAHVYGRAVDIAALGGTSILGHQQPGGITEEAVKDILLLPSEVIPKQVISLLGLGGPSFPLADHYNHIHVGY